MLKYGDFIYRNINEQVELLTQITNKLVEIYSPLGETIKNLQEAKQDTVSEDLQTISKNIVSAINELLKSVNDLNLALNSKIEEVKANFETSLNNEISRASIKENDLQEKITAENDRAVANEEDLQKKINTNKNNISLNDTKIANLQTSISNIDNDINQIQNDLQNKQEKTDTTLTTANKTIVGAINEINNKKTEKVKYYLHKIYFDFRGIAKIHYQLINTTSDLIDTSEKLYYANNENRRIPFTFNNYNDSSSEFVIGVDDYMGDNDNVKIITFSQSYNPTRVVFNVMNFVIDSLNDTVTEIKTSDNLLRILNKQTNK